MNHGFAGLTFHSGGYCGHESECMGPKKRHFVKILARWGVVADREGDAMGGWEPMKVEAEQKWIEQWFLVFLQAGAASECTGRMNCEESGEEQSKWGAVQGKEFSLTMMRMNDDRLRWSPDDYNNPVRGFIFTLLWTRSNTKFFLLKGLFLYIKFKHVQSVYLRRRGLGLACFHAELGASWHEAFIIMDCAHIGSGLGQDSVSG